MTDSQQPILEFDRAVLQELEGLGHQEISFTLASGHVLWLAVDPEHVEELADAVSGLVVPDSGRILYRGQTWLSRHPDDQAAQRATMGRLFSHKGWISNLDIDENMILARYHHGDGREADLLEACRAVANELRLDMKNNRPEEVHPRQLHPLQWIRALTGPSDLLVVGCRSELLNPAIEERLFTVLERRLRDGLAIIWIGNEFPERLWGVPLPELYAKLSLSEKSL